MWISIKNKIKSGCFKGILPQILGQVRETWLSNYPHELVICKKSSFSSV